MDEIELGPLERSWGTAVQASPVNSCLTAAEWIEFVERAESADFYSRAILHLAQCLECRQTVQEMRTAELARTTSESSNRVRSPFFGLLKPLTLFGAAAVLALGSAILLTQWNSNKGSAKAQGPSGVVARTSPAPHTQSTEPVIRPIRPTRNAGSPRAHRGADRTSPATNAPPTGAHPNDIDDPSAPATDQQYCLIGSDGVFTMPSPDYRLKDRQKIEEAYADRVDIARKHFDANTGAERDPDEVTAQLNQDLESAAEERDQKLGTIYQKRDGARDKPLNLRLEAGTPYQVVEVDYKRQRNLKQPVRVVVHEPWPGYSPARRPYGWDYERPYEPTEFKSRYTDWRKSYVAAGRPAFCGLVGHAGAVRVDTIFGSRYEGYAASREIARHSTAASPNPEGYTHSQTRPESPRSTWSGYTHSPSPGSTGPATTPGPMSNGYTHSQSSPPDAGKAPSIGGYTHSAPGGAKGYSRSGRGQKQTSGQGYSGSRAGDL